MGDNLADPGTLLQSVYGSGLIKKGSVVQAKIKLFAIDIDGTLTDSRKQITPKTREALLEAQKKQGVRILLASARPTHGLYQTAEQLDMAENHGILMAYNGGRVVDAVSGEVYTETHMNLERTRKILRFLEMLPVTIILDDGERFYVTDPNGYKVQYESHNNGMECVQVDRLSDFVSFAPIKILLSVDPDRIYDVQAEIAAELDEDLAVVRTAPFYLEIFPKSINKGDGLRKICRMLGIRKEETAAFGDSENDIPMLREAGIGIAMGNAEQVVKDIADYITLSNDKDGIAYAIRQWIA